jgi:hypothetical protein
MTKGKKTKRTIVEEELPPEPSTEFAEVQAGDLPSNLDQVIDEMEDQVDKVVLYRVSPGQKQAYLRTITIDEAGDGGVQDYVARYYGGGQYLARLQHGRLFVKGYTFRIDESVKPQAAPSTVALAVAPGNTVTDGLVIKLLEKAVDGGGKTDLAGMMQAIATIAAGQASAMMTAMTPLLAKITELASGGGKGGSMADLVAAINLGAELGGDKEEGYLPVLREVGVPLVKALETYMAQMQTKRGAASPVRSIQPAVAAASPGTPAPAVAPEQPTGPPWVAMLAPYVPKLVDFAVHGGDPNIVAGLVYRSNPPLARFLEDAVTDPAFAPALVQHFPALAPHGLWVGQLLDEFREDEADETDLDEADEMLKKDGGDDDGE